MLRNVERMVREEMDRLGAQEVLFPALLPREPYETTGRWDAYGPDIFRLVDRRGADHLLAPTHEEMFTLLARAELARTGTCRCRSTRCRRSSGTSSGRAPGCCARASS